MKYLSPQDVNAGSEFTSLCDGLPNSAYKEQAIRVYCLAAQMYGRWGLAQEELDKQDVNGRFYWNGLIVAGWFEEVTGPFGQGFIIAALNFADPNIPGPYADNKPTTVKKAL